MDRPFRQSWGQVCGPHFQASRRLHPLAFKVLLFLEFHGRECSVPIQSLKVVTHKCRTMHIFSFDPTPEALNLKYQTIQCFRSPLHSFGHNWTDGQLHLFRWDLRGILWGNFAEPPKIQRLSTAVCTTPCSSGSIPYSAKIPKTTLRLDTTSTPRQEVDMID